MIIVMPPPFSIGVGGIITGLPRSGKKFWKMKIFQVREKSGKSQGITFSVREI